MAEDVVIFGGAMNPICLHHLIGGAFVASQPGMNVWFMPCFDHRFGKNMATGNERLAMCNRGVHWLNGLYPQTFMASGYEISKHHNGSTYELLDMLTDDHPEYKFHFVIGMDNANIIEEKWHKGSDLIQKHPFVVLDRPGYEPSVDWFRSEPHQHVQFQLPGSSSDFRTAMEERRHDEAARLVGHFNWNYITEHNLYGFSPEVAHG